MGGNFKYLAPGMQLPIIPTSLPSPMGPIIRILPLYSARTPQVFQIPLSSSKPCEDRGEGHPADEETDLQEEQEAGLDLTPSLTTLGMEGASHLVIPYLSRAKPCAPSSLQGTGTEQGSATWEHTERGTPPRSTAFWTGGGASPGRAHPGGGGGDCPPGGQGPEGDSSSTDRAHDSGPWGPLPVATDMASMALLSQDVMFWSLWKQAGVGNPHKAV